MSSSGEVLYAVPTYLLILGMLVSLFVVTATGVRFGRARSSIATKAEKSQVSAMQASLMGLLALLVSFSFSLSLSRFNDRSLAVVSEANTIGTAWLRSDLLTGAPRDALRAALADYAAARLAEGQFDITHADGRAPELERSAAAFAAAWSLATAAARATPNPATVSLVSALNDMIDAFSSHEAALTRHVPEIVLIFQFVTLLFLGWIIGAASGEEKTRPATPLLVMMVLIVLLLALVIDLDRPRRGVITVDQTPLFTTVTQILTEAGRPLPAGT